MRAETGPRAAHCAPSPSYHQDCSLGPGKRGDEGLQGKSSQMKKGGTGRARGDRDQLHHPLGWGDCAHSKPTPLSTL